jgi:hypothetical protein
VREGSFSKAMDAPQYAIRYDDLLSENLAEYFDDFSCLFHIPIGVDFTCCDQMVPMVHQLPSLWYLSNLSRADWDVVDIQVSQIPGVVNERVARLSAIGQLATDGGQQPVRLEYFWTEEWSCYAPSVGMLWGAVIGSCGDHPFVVTPQFNYGNSDGSSSEFPPIPICQCSERAVVESPSFGSVNPMNAFEHRITNSEKMDAILGHLLRVFSMHCADRDH